MKTVFIVGNFPVLSYTPILNQITGLIDRGHGVDIFAFSRGDTEHIHSDVEKYDLLSKVVYLDPLSSISDRVRSARLVINEKVSRKTGIKLPSLIFFRYIRDLITLANFIILTSLNKNKPYDIVHCQMGSVGLRFLQLHRLRLLGGKLVVQFRGEDITEFVKMNGKMSYRKLF